MKQYKEYIKENTTVTANVSTLNQTVFKKEKDFMGMPCFSCPDSVFANVVKGKKKHKNWSHHFGNSPEAKQFAKEIQAQKIKNFYLMDQKHKTVMNVRGMYA